MQKSILIMILTMTAGGAFAKADCPKYEKSQWMPEAEAKSKIEALGYKIDKFKIDGNCYEIYGTNKDGKKAEVYFDAKNLDIVKAEIQEITAGDSMTAARIRVWDPLVRFVHWSVAVLVVCDLFNEAGANPWHRYLGYAAGALVAIRLVWGVFATHHARLVSMASSARALPAYLKAARAGQARFYAGHNPLGAWMAFALWGLVLVVAITGWMLQLDAYWGDESLQTLHAAAAYLLALCAVVHVAGVLITSAMSRTNLVKGMITGIKSIRDSAAEKP